jgi:hypothetical protein
MSVYVVRAFVQLRELLASNAALACKLNELEAHPRRLPSAGLRDRREVYVELGEILRGAYPDGVPTHLRTNSCVDQEKTMIANQLIANAVISQIVADQARVIQQLKSEGHPFKLSDVKHLNPYDPTSTAV